MQHRVNTAPAGSLLAKKNKNKKQPALATRHLGEFLPQEGRMKQHYPLHVSDSLIPLKSTWKGGSSQHLFSS